MLYGEEGDKINLYSAHSNLEISSLYKLKFLAWFFKNIYKLNSNSIGKAM